MQAICEKEKVIEALEKAKAAGVEIPAMDAIFPAKPQKPRWYTREAWNLAKLDFGDFKEGVTVTLRDCPTKIAREIREVYARTKETRESEVATTYQVIAMLCKGHLADVRGEGKGEVFNVDAPKNAADVSEWKKWTDEMQEKALARLHEGIIFFRNDVGELGNE